MKILIFGLSANKGGVESFILNYCDIILKTHYDIKIDFIIIDNLPENINWLKEKGCDFFVVPNRVKNMVEYRRKMYKIVRDGQYDCIWYNTCTLSDVTLLKIGTKLKIPTIIVHSHNSENMGNSINMLLHQLHQKSLSKIATHFFACSDLAGKFMFTEKELTSSNYHIVRNAINIEKYKFNSIVREEIRQKKQWEGKIVLGHIGRFHSQKNHEQLIEIFEDFYRKEKNAVLVLIGEGELKADIQNLVKKKKLEDVVSFLGNIDNVNEYLQAMDVFVMPSLYEGLPMVLVEAQTAGLPCCISDKISKQANLTNKVKFVSLDDSLDQWGNMIKSLLENNRREEVHLIVKEKGYDIIDNSNEIFKWI